jgi:DNA-binding MarR family transcriptional regulator
VTSSPSPGVPLARLLAMAFRQLIDRLHERLAEEGWHDVRGPYGFVLLAVRDAEMTATGLTELLGVTKQATSQLLDAMEREGYVRRRSNAADARVKRVEITARGRKLLAAVESIYAQLDAEWATHIGSARVEAMRAGLQDVLAGVYGDALPPVRPTW